VNNNNHHKLRQAVKILIPAIMLLLILLVPNSKVHAFSYEYSTFPAGNLGINRPEIGAIVTPSESITLSSFTMYVNGLEVQASYKSESNSFTYQPSSDLSAGAYNIKLVLRYEGYQEGSLEWDFKVLQGASATLSSEPSKEQDEGLQAINDYRIVNQLPEVKFHPALNAAAQKHAQYLALNNVGATDASLHDEISSKPGYIGKSLKERGEYVGYTKGIAEDVAFTTNSLTEAVDDLFLAPYHRIPFLNPNVTEVGVFREGNYHVIVFGIEKVMDSQLIVSPAEGDAYVPIIFEGNEIPDPIRLHRSLSYPVGYPIMASVTGPDILKVSLTQAELLDDKGNKVKLLHNHQGNDEHLDTDVILLPATPLLPDTAYQAYIKVTAVNKDGSSQKFEKNWQFRTEPAKGIGTKKLHENSAVYVQELIDLGLGRKHTVSFGLDDDQYVFDQISYPMKRKPIIQEGASYLYIRDLAAALGATVEWDDSRKAAVYTKKNLTISFFTGRNVYEINGKEYQTISPAQLIDEYTMIPVRLLSQTLGANVEYIEHSRTVVITY
jgi:uncharacterized protein YkwD